MHLYHLRRHHAAQFPDTTAAQPLLTPVYVLLGVLCLNHYTILYVCGTAIAVVGVAFVALNFVPGIEAPRWVAHRS